MSMWILMNAIWMKRMVGLCRVFTSFLKLFFLGAIHPTTGEYSYFMTETYPWVPMYYYGDGGVADLCSAI